MWLELILLGVILIGVAVLFYRGAVHEFQILQHDWSDELHWTSLLSERAPLVIRDLPTELQGSWRRTATTRRSWPVLLENKDGSVRTPWHDWINTPVSNVAERTIVNGERLAESAGLPEVVRDWRSAGFYRWTWLPTSSTSVHLLPPSDTACKPLEQISSDCKVFVCTDGTPARLWLAHEGSIPSDLAKQIQGRNPWTLSSEEFPWIVDIKFIEMRLRPGQAVVLPTHWWIAVKPELPVVSDAPVVADGCWFWTAELDTPVSWMIGLKMKTDRYSRTKRNGFRK